MTSECTTMTIEEQEKEKNTADNLDLLVVGMFAAVVPQPWNQNQGHILMTHRHHIPSDTIIWLETWLMWYSSQNE